MMIFTGIFLLMVYGVSLLKGGLFKKITQELKEVSVNKEEHANLDEKELKKIWSLIGKTSLIALFSIFMLITFLIFTINALAVDIFLYPTLIMMTIIIGGVITGFIRDKNRKPNKFMGHVRRFTMVGYIIYILFLLIV